MTDQVDTLLSAAASARRRGSATEERRYLANAAAVAAVDPRVQNAIGLRAIADAEPAAAIAAFARAVAADPGEPSLHLNLATAHRMASDCEGERRALQAALDIDQLQFMAQLRMAELVERLGEDAAAARHWSAVVQLAGGMDPVPPLAVDAAARGDRFLKAHHAEYRIALERAIGGSTGAVAGSADADRRFRACVDHVTGRRRIFRNECAGVHYPFLPAEEFFPRSLFPWFDELEAAVPVIREEVLALLTAPPADGLRPYVRLDRGTPVNKWTGLDGSLAWGACFLWEYGIVNDAVCERCPATAAALAAVPQNHIPGKAPSAFFSVLRGGAHIPPHTGVTNTRTIVHLPLVVPPDCSFRVGGETRAWREGEAFAFDDTIEHEAWNRSEQQRIVLIFDVWNPYLSPREQALLTTLFEVSDSAAVSPKAG